MFDKYLHRPVFAVLFQEIMSFCQTKLKKIKKNKKYFFFFAFSQKFYNYLSISFFKKKNISKISWHVLKKILHGFYNKFVKFQGILTYILKILKNYFWQENIIHFNIRIKNLYEVNIQNIIENNTTHSLLI